MKILQYNDLNIQKVKPQFNKVVEFLKKSDFKSADVKKLVNHGLYRAKLDYENRLLFKIADFGNEKYILLLEIIYNHEYNKSRFLGGAVIDENKLKPILSADKLKEEDSLQIPYVNTVSQKFHLLDKIISFDSNQEDIFKIKPPLIIVGSAGSGKTALTLEKIKELKGSILYVTLSPFLADNSSRIYYSNNYINEDQDVDFLHFKEFLDTFLIVPGKELTFKVFDSWLQTRLHQFGLKDSHKLFEELRGVITGMEVSKPYLSENDYLNLGIKQSIFLDSERKKVYDVFIKYLDFISENNYHDLNLVSFNWLKYVKPKYDFIIIDEVQDFTNIQLYVVLQTLFEKGSFILCGDSNQIVHPNFFSWSKVKTMFYKQDLSGSELRILRTNYRNSVEITGFANRLLKIKNTRFGSIDKESTFLVEAIQDNRGQVVLMLDNSKNREELNAKTAKSTKYAVIVMKQEDKADARRMFKSPLLFSIHEAKGLEYENVILLNFISANAREFHEICSGVLPEHIDDANLVFSRGKDKADKSLDAYKFYINSLYVAITRSIKNVFILESSHKHELLQLLELVESKEKLNIKAEVSSVEDWKNEATRLELQGKKEQADEIRESYLGIQKPDWIPITPDNIDDLKNEALDEEHFNKKAKDKLFAYCLIYGDVNTIEKLSELKYRRADDYKKERLGISRKYYPEYQSDNIRFIEQYISKYGINCRDQFNLTPLLVAIQTGSMKIVDFLLSNNPDTSACDNTGKNVIQIALFQAYQNPNYLRSLSLIYHKIISSYIKIKVDNRMIKINNQKFEYFLLNLYLAIQPSLIAEKKKKTFEDPAIKALDIAEIVSRFPDSVLPEYRRKNTYISSMLAKNEIDSNNPYCNKLFYRTTRGKYILNPELEIMANDNWINVYTLIGQNLEDSHDIGKNNEISFDVIKRIRESMMKTQPELYEKLKYELMDYPVDDRMDFNKSKQTYSKKTEENKFVKNKGDLKKVEKKEEPFDDKNIQMTFDFQNQRFQDTRKKDC